MKGKSLEDNLRHEEKIKNMGFFYIEYPTLVDEEPALEAQAKPAAKDDAKPAAKEEAKPVYLL